ncbi:prolyl 4-hydroxylase subunit alpha-1-like isoform X1 [Convolutriloba macropyga]|uniref:prolyl 4-hydroxylase subunit alpha-1-like isoform X1 n=2 Tax=Convolutriloba macropyga TaxID=536237 RepID=UPI003F528EB5
MRGTFFSLQYNSLTIFVLLTCHHHYEFGCEAQQGSKANSKASKEKQVDTSHGGLYASGDKLLYLFQYDFKLCQGVRDVLQYSLVLQELLKEEDILKDVTYPVKKPPWTDPHIIYHPINQYILVYKFSKVWPKFKRILSTLTRNGSTTATWDTLFDNPQQIVTYPQFTPMLKDIETLTISAMDLKKAALGLLRLQELYQLDTSAIVKGKIKTYRGLRGLRPGEIEVFVEAAIDYNDKCRALEWLRQSAVSSAARYNLSLSVRMKKADQEKCDKQYCIRGDQCLDEKRELEVSYERLCREPEKHSTPDPTLKCGLWREKPEFIWKPLKVEWMLENPTVFVIYDFFTDDEIDDLWDASPTLSRGVMVTDDEKMRFSETRSGNTAWLGDHEAPIAAKLSHRVGRAINKSMTTADKWQLGNYGIGGHYYFHSDYFEDKYLPLQWFYPLGWENRLVTFMVYLSDVAEGGYTAFPILNLAVKPRKGTALVWHNLNSDGVQEPRTYHGGCPVLMGNKRIANKWIHYGGQPFTDPCLPKGLSYDHSYSSRLW